MSSTYPGGRPHRVSTTLSQVALYHLERMADRLSTTRAALLRELVLIATGAPELRPMIKEAMKAHLTRSDK